MNRVRIGKSLALALVLACGTPAVFVAQAAANTDTLTPWHIATLRGVRSAAISPDGRFVAYTLSIPREPWEEEDGSARSELHVFHYDSGEGRPFVTADSGASRVRWTPDSRSIAFLAKREGDEHRSLYVLPVNGGEARRAVHFEDRSVGQYDFSPDGEKVAVLATTPKSKGRKDEEKKGFKQEIYEEDWRPSELWIATPFDEDDEPTRIPIEGHVSSVHFSPDGERVAVAVAPTSLVDDSYILKRLWVVNVASAEVDAKIENGGKLGAFVWNPTGTGLALIAGFDEHDGAAARLLWAGVSSDGSSVAPAPMLGERERDEQQAVWLADGRLIVRGSQGAWSTLDAYRVEDGAALERRPLLPLEGPAITSVSISRDGSRAALVGSRPDHPGEVFTLKVGSGNLRQRTNSNEWLSSMRLAKQEVIRYEARDGLAIEGILIHPRDGRTPAPLIVCVHGGPESHLSNGWLTRYSYPGQIAAADGYAVFYPNYRGSTGRGLAYLKQSQGDPAGKEFDDIVDGVDHLIDIGLVDRERVGVTGGSYGGYATAWCSTFYSHRFAAGVMFVGISNKISKVGTTDIPDEEYYVHALKRPWDNWHYFLERSPIFHADKGKTPLLILHGKDDPRVDPGQSREMYRHLKLRGKAPVRLVHYPGEGHGNRRSGARFDYSLRQKRWFDHYLKGAGGEAPDADLDYKAHLPAQETPEETTGS